MTETTKEFAVMLELTYREAYDAGYEAGKASANEVEWREIDGVDSLPKERQHVWALPRYGSICITQFDFGMSNFYLAHYTHWAEIKLPKSPQLPKSPETPSSVT